MKGNGNRRRARRRGGVASGEAVKAEGGRVSSFSAAFCILVSQFAFNFLLFICFKFNKFFK